MVRLSTPARRPRGTPAGGQFVGRDRAEAAPLTDLDPIDPDRFPVGLLHDYDDLCMVGNDGWTVDRLDAAVAATGRIDKHLDIGFSAAEIARGNFTIYVFDGHHRLAVARKRHLAHVPARSAWRAEDAVPIKGIPDEFGDDVGEYGIEHAVDRHLDRHHAQRVEHKADAPHT